MRKALFMHLVAMFILLTANFPQDQYRTGTMKSLADAERAFAAMSVETGAREAFLANFADDGIAFQPHPVVYREAAKNRPAPADPKAFTLNWKPLFGDVAESGDLGYTTGPYSLADNSRKQPTRHGFYFSVWKRDSAFHWRVALDIGIAIPDKYEGSDDFRQAASLGKRKPAGDEAGSGKDELEKIEEHFSSLSAAGGVTAAYERYLAADCRLHVEGHHPFVGQEEIRAFVTGRRHASPLFAAVSRSNDFGYTYGSYKNSDNGGATEHGYFGHVWKRNEMGNWKLVAEILSPIPAGSP